MQTEKFADVSGYETTFKASEGHTIQMGGDVQTYAITAISVIHAFTGDIVRIRVEDYAKAGREGILHFTVADVPSPAMFQWLEAGAVTEFNLPWFASAGIAAHVRTLREWAKEAAAAV